MKNRLAVLLLLLLLLAIGIVWKARKLVPAPPRVADRKPEAERMASPKPTVQVPSPAALPSVGLALSRAPAGEGGAGRHGRRRVRAPEPLHPKSESPKTTSEPAQAPAIIPLPPAETPSPQEWKGNNDSSIARSGQIVVQNDEQWIRFWAEHHPHEAAPEVDFSQRMVVGVFLGQRPADGFKVDIQGVRTLPDAMIVDYLESAPPPGTFQIGVTVFPYDIQIIPRSALPVKFNKLTPQYQREEISGGKKML